MCVDSKTTTKKNNRECATYLSPWVPESPSHAELKPLLWLQETFWKSFLLRKLKASSSRTHSQLSQVTAQKPSCHKSVWTHTHLHLHILDYWLFWECLLYLHLTYIWAPSIYLLPTMFNSTQSTSTWTISDNYLNFFEGVKSISPT